MKAIRIVLASLRKADSMFNLINHGDKIVIGLSGGKDSLALTYCLNLYKKFSHTDFTIQPVTLDLGFDNFNPKPLEQFCESLGLKLIVADSREVYPILKKQQELQNLKHLPCSICSRMKKAAINKVAKELGFNKVAFAHHADDAIETLLMNEIYGGRIATFAPKMHLENADIDFIRPFILTKEEDIKRLIKEENINAIPSNCPADKHTTREDIKLYLNHIYDERKEAKENFLSMLYNYQGLDIWTDEIYYQINQEGLCLKPVTTTDDIYEMINIRHKVFVEGQSVSFDEEFVINQEKKAFNFLIYKDKTPIGTIRYRILDDGIKLERFAIIEEQQRKGYGRQVFQFIGDYIYKKYNPCVIYFNAQYRLIDFYKSLGYEVDGEPFIEAGIKHIRMKKSA